MRRSRSRIRTRVLATLALVAGSVTAAAVTYAPLAQAVAPTAPSSETARSLYLNNWADTAALWMAPQLAQTDANTQYGPRLAELRYSPSGPAASSAVNQINDYTGSFRDDTHGLKYDQVHNFGSATGFLDSGGVLRTDYGPYSGTATTVSIGRDYAVVPNQHFIVASYRLTNSGASAVTMNVLDALHLNNTGSAGQNVHATWDATRNADVIDMSASGQYQLVLGSFGPPTGHQVGDDTVSSLTSPTVAPWYTFDHDGNPSLGTWPAATNPIAYGYKSWVRDSAVTAMALDTAGHHAEADKYFRWLATVQYADGSFGTTYDNWTGQHASFVEPELDSVGTTVGFVLVFFALINSVIANQNAANNSSTRTMFSMGRIRLLPTQYGALTRGSPMLALITQVVVSIGVALWLGNQYDPYTGFVILATILVDIFAPMYILLNIACIAYFWRHRRAEFNWWLHGLIPVLGALAFIPAFCAGAGIPAFSFITALPKPLSYAGPAAAIWMAIGVVYLVVLLLNRPSRITETKRVFAEE